LEKKKRRRVPSVTGGKGEGLAKKQRKKGATGARQSRKEKKIVAESNRGKDKHRKILTIERERLNEYG